MSNKGLYAIIGLLVVIVCILGYKSFVVSDYSSSPNSQLVQSTVSVGVKEDVVSKVEVGSTQPIYSLSGGKLIRTSPDSSIEVIANLVDSGVSVTEGCGNSPSEVLGGLHILGHPTVSQKIFFVEGCAEGGGTVWSFDLSTKTAKKLTTRFVFGSASESPEGNFQVRLGPSNGQGEVRTLEIADFYNDKTWLTDSLPENYTYTKTISEFDGASTGYIFWQSSGVVYAEIYLSGISLDTLDYRTGIFMKRINLSQ